MARVYVRTVPGRVARVAPQGRYIPYDGFIGVELTPYMHRLIHVHGDVEVQSAPVAKRQKPTETPVTE